MTEARQLQPVDYFRRDLGAMKSELQKALPPQVSVEKFERVTMTAIQMNPDLLNCDKRSLFSSITKAAQTGLMIDNREAAITKFGNQAQLMVMTSGLMKLVRNSGELASIDAQIVYKEDKFTYRPGVDLVPNHEPDWFGERGDAIGVYAVAKMKDGAAYVEILNKKQIETIRNVSKSKNSGPWTTWWDEMWRKSAIRRLSKRLPMSTDLDGALTEDDELFQPPVQQAAPAPMQPVEEVQPQPASRPSRLRKVVEQEPVQDVAPVQQADDDGVIDMPPAPPAEAYTDHDDSPI